MDSNSKVLVLGGSGFLGRTLVEQLLEQKACATLSIFDVHIHEEYEKNPVFREGVQHRIKGDITSAESVKQALQKTGCDTIFHCATPSPFAPAKILRMVNIDGTKVLLKVLKETKQVKRLILTSTASVVFTGADILNADEKTPYAGAGYNVYTDSKIQQETMVLFENNKEGLATVSLRPSSIFGPRDGLFLPNIVDNAKKGRLKFYIGSGQNLYDFTYVKNVAQSEILAAQQLTSPTSKCAGKAYFVTNDEQKKFWEMAGDIAVGFGYERPKYGIPFPIYYCICLLIAVLFWFLNLLPCLSLKVPISMSFDKLRLITSHRTFSCARAKKDLGYKPISMKQAMKETIAAYPHLQKNYKVAGKKDA